jgi:hypothetical protein
MSPRRNGEQLRSDIDSGRTGDKVDHPDPAAAPLGTDAEAGGAATEFPDERRAGPHKRSGTTGFWVYFGAVVMIGAIATILIWLALNSR